LGFSTGPRKGLVMALLDAVAPTPKDSEMARKTTHQLSRLAQPGKSLKVVPQNGSDAETLEIPASAVPVIQAVLKAMAQGDAVAVVPTHAELTTQQAADLLGVSRPFLIKVLKEGRLPHRKVGMHRRIMFKDLLEYKRSMQEKRRETLDKLVAESEDLGVGY